MGKSTIETLKSRYKEALDGDLSEQEFKSVFYETLSPIAIAIAVNNTANLATAKDIVQHVFLKFMEQPLEKFAGFFTEENLIGYLATIVKNRCRTHYRLDKKWREQADLDQAKDVSDRIIDISTELDYQAMLTGLPKELAAIFELKRQGYKFREIAEWRGISEGVAKKRFYEARNTLRDSIE